MLDDLHGCLENCPSGAASVTRQHFPDAERHQGAVVQRLLQGQASWGRFARELG